MQRGKKSREDTCAHLLGIDEDNSDTGDQEGGGDACTHGSCADNAYRINSRKLAWHGRHAKGCAFRKK